VPPSPPTASLPCRRFHLPLRLAPRVPSPVLIECFHLLLQVWWTARVSSDCDRTGRRLPRWPRLCQPHLHWVVSLDPIPNVMAAAPVGCSPRGVIQVRSSRSYLPGVARGTSMPSSGFHPLASYSVMPSCNNSCGKKCYLSWFLSPSTATFGLSQKGFRFSSYTICKLQRAGFYFVFFLCLRLIFHDWYSNCYLIPFFEQHMPRAGWLQKT
jgi:hypothetical protein